MNSPVRNFAMTRRAVIQYDQSYNTKVFVPVRYKEVDGYECVHVLPEDGSFFYRMDGRKSFAFSGENGRNVFGANRNTYFGVQPKDLMTAYNRHTHLYVIEPNTPIVLIDMGNLENIRRLSADPKIAHNIRSAFPINGDVVKRHSVPAEDHIDKIDHDRRALDYICSIPGIDGYYVAVEGLHPEIGFCKGSLAKVDVVDMFRVHTEQVQRGTKKRPRSFQESNNENKFPSIRRRGHFDESSENTKSTFMNRLRFDGGKRKRSKTVKRRRIQRK